MPRSEGERRRAGFPRRGLGDLLLDARVVGEEGFEPVPDLEGLVVFLGALVDAAQGLEDVEEIGAGGFSCEGAFECLGGVFGLTDQDEGLSEVEGGQGVARPVGFGVLESGDGGGILPALEFEEAEDEPGGAVVGFLVEAVAIRLDEGVERAAFDVVSVDAVERRAAARVFFEQGEEPLHRPPLAGLDSVGRVSGCRSAAGRSARSRFSFGRLR